MVERLYVTHTHSRNTALWCTRPHNNCCSTCSQMVQRAHYCTLSPCLSWTYAYEWTILLLHGAVAVGSSCITSQQSYMRTAIVDGCTSALKALLLLYPLGKISCIVYHPLASWRFLDCRTWIWWSLILSLESGCQRLLVVLRPVLEGLALHDGAVQRARVCGSTGICDVKPRSWRSRGSVVHCTRQHESRGRSCE